MSIVFLIMVIAFLLLMLMASKGVAQQVIWQPAGNHFWHDPTNWRPSKVPDYNDTVLILGTPEEYCLIQSRAEAGIIYVDGRYQPKLLVQKGWLNVGTMVISNRDSLGVVDCNEAYITCWWLWIRDNGELRLKQTQMLVEDCIINEGSIIHYSGVLAVCGYGGYSGCGAYYPIGGILSGCSRPIADLNFDGQVDLKDLAILARGWLE